MNLEKKLINAVIIGDCDLLENLLELLYQSNTEASNKNNQLLEVRDQSGNTLLHLAVIRCGRPLIQFQPDRKLEDIIDTNTKLFQILLGNPNCRIDPFSKNDEGQTPLHIFHAKKPTQIPNIENMQPISKRILAAYHRRYIDEYMSLAFPDFKLVENANPHQKIINAVDNAGFTALLNSVKHNCRHCVQKLLRYWADLNISSGDAYFPFATPRIFHQDPWACAVFESRLNKCITYDDDTTTNYPDNSLIIDELGGEVNETGFEISMDFSLIVPNVAIISTNNVEPVREMPFIETLLNADTLVRKQILGHPLVASFVFMKWEKVRWMFIWSFILHIGLAILYTTFIMNVYLINCPYKSPKNSSTDSQSNQTLSYATNCDTGLGSFEFSVTLLVVALVLAVLEVAKLLVQNPRLYLKEWHNAAQIAMIVCLCLSAWPLRWTNCGCLKNWQYSTAAYGIFHVWSTLLINVGRWPKLGIYVEMFGTVLSNFGYLMMAYIFLLIAFSISFCVVFPDFPPFETIPRAVLKVITMMSGDVEYQEFFYGSPKHDPQPTSSIFRVDDSGDLIHPITGHILYGSFVVLVTIVLTNLLIGLAVHDIKGLGENAEFTKTNREIANIAYVESLIFWNKLPNLSLIRRLRNSIVIGRYEAQRKTSTTAESRKSGYFEFFNRIERVVSRLLRFRKDFVLDTEQNESSSRRQSSQIFGKYNYKIGLDDCKLPRAFPEDTYLKAVEIIRRRGKNSSK